MTHSNVHKESGNKGNQGRQSLLGNSEIMESSGNLGNFG